MMGKFKKYKNYKDSRFGWLGEIPIDWKTIRAKFLFSERVQKGFPEKPLLAATQKQGVVKKEDYGTRTVTAQKDFHLLKLVKVGDFVISLRSFQGGIEISYEEGIISPAYTIMIPSEKLDRNYIKHLFKSNFFILSLNRFVTGIREGQNIDYKKFKNSFLPVPPLNVQKVIANFLDEKTKQIDNYIQLKEKTIALIQERKVAIINQAVTEGLDSNVPMKDSKIEWLGRIPVHWEVKKLKFTVSKVGSGLTPSGGATTYKDKGIPFLRSQNIHFDRIDFSNITCIDEKVHNKMNNSKVFPEDVLLNITGGSLGRCYFVTDEFKEANVNQHVCIIRPTKINSKFLYFLLYSKVGQDQIWFFQYGGGREGLNLQSIKNFYLPFPERKEQIKIVEYLTKKLSKSNHKVNTILKEIALIKEYRASLISAAVTGKIDVRTHQQSQQAASKKVQTVSTELSGKKK